MKIVINLGTGNLDQGCNHVVVQLLNDNYNCQRQFSGSLPPAPELAQLHRQWQFGYRAFYQERSLRIGLLQSEGLRYSAADFKAICEQIPQKLNSWLGCDEFAPIERALRTDLSQNELTQIVITATEQQLQQLPWHLWNLIADYPQAEVTFSAPNWQKMAQTPKKPHQVRILAILGNSQGLELQKDVASLVNLPDTELKILREPSQSELNEYLWQTKGWDILLFSGHSHSDLTTGYIYLNDREKITITQLKQSLRKAIANGLQIAIFNSCEGIKLALELADLSIPYTVVMGEPVPDRIAQVFLQYFLTAFVAGKTFTLAVKEARQKLAGWESEFVCASWLPIIWQNPTVDYLTWQDLAPVAQAKQRQKLLKTALLSSLVVSGLVMLLRSLSWLEPLELKAYDRLIEQRPAETIDPRIVVVEITEADTNSDRYPISEQALVTAIDLLVKHQPAAIGLDIHRSYERGVGYQDLLQRLATNSHIFPVCSYGSSNDSYAPPEGLGEAKLRQQMGFSDLLIDGRHSATKSSLLDLTNQDLQHYQSPKVRRQLLSYEPSLAASPSKCLTPYSLSFQLAFEYLQQAGIEPLTVNSAQQWQFGEAIFSEMTSKFGGYQQLDGQSSQIMLNYRAGQPGKRISLTQLRSGIAPQLIQNRIVIIGYTASVARDYFDTPYGTMPGVWIHAHMTSQLLSTVQDGRSLIWVLPSWGDWLWILSWSMVMGIILSLLSPKPVIYSWLGLGVMLIVLDRICLLLLIQGGWLPYIPTIFALFTITAIFIISQRYNMSRKEKIIFGNRQ
ncbi:MAG TPA: CHASE2 domain-containing protein [Xenococcaceae cyanobacterium]